MSEWEQIPATGSAKKTNKLQTRRVEVVLASDSISLSFGMTCSAVTHGGDVQVSAYIIELQAITPSGVKDERLGLNDVTLNTEPGFFNVFVKSCSRGLLAVL